MKRVIELIRVSTEGQAAEDRAGIPAQRAANRRTAQNYGLEIIRTVEYSDVSGASVLLAPEMQELLRLMESPDVHGVIAREFSRLMRPEDYTDFALLQHFVNTHTLLYLPEGPIDFGSKTGRLLGTIRAAMAGVERLEILEKVWEAKEAKRRAGKHPQNKNSLPFGVDFDEQKGWYYKPEAEKIREVFRLVLSGIHSYVDLGRRVGIDPYSLRVMLRNPIYTGLRVIDTKRDTSPGAKRVKPDGRQADRPKVKRPPEEIIRVRVIEEGLISEEEFARAQQILDAKKARHWRAKSGHVWRFTYNGFLTCPECDSLIYTKFQRGDYYVCRGRIIEKRCRTSYMRREKLEPLLDRLLSTRLTDEGFLREMGLEAERRASADPDRNRAERLEGQLASLEERREKILDAYFDGVIDFAERDARLKKVESEAAVLREMLARARPRPMLTAESFAATFSPFFEYEFLARGDKRRLLSAIVPEIRVADYCVEGLFVLPGFSRELSRTGRGSSSRRA